MSNLQKENDQLRVELRAVKRSAELAESELGAIKSGQKEARAIAESADVHAATSAALAQRLAVLTALIADLESVIRCYEQGCPIPLALTGRIRDARRKVHA